MAYTNDGGGGTNPRSQPKQSGSGGGHKGTMGTGQTKPQAKGVMGNGSSKCAVKGVMGRG